MAADTVRALGTGDLLDLGLALALGLLVGIQRGWVQRKVADGTRFAGVRTYGLFGLLGGIAGVAMPRMEAFATVLLSAGAGLVLIGYWRGSRMRDAVSGTGAVVGLLTLACGFLAGTGQVAAATAATGSCVVLLALRRQLHRLIGSLDEREVMAIGRFALIALVILPLLPDGAYGPFGAWRPRSLWLVVVMVSGFSFAGYLATKWLGPARATLATAAAGSLVSSTAVTAALAGRHARDDGDPRMLNAGIALGSAVMFVRVMVLTGALASHALPALALCAVPGMVVSLAATALLARRAAEAAPREELKLTNPFDLGPAIGMMALVMLLTLVTRWTLSRFGDAGLAVVLAISGTVDVDSAIITLGSLPHDTLPAHHAGLVLVPAIVLNTLFKLGVAGSVGGWRRTRAGTVTLGLSALAVLAGVPVVLGVMG